MTTVGKFSAPNSGGGCNLPPEARKLLAETPGAKAVICKNPNGSRFVRVFTSPDVADCVCPDWTHEDFCERNLFACQWLAGPVASIPD